MRIELKFKLWVLKTHRILSLLCSWLVYSITELPRKTLKKNNLAIYTVLNIFSVFCASLGNPANSGGLYDMSRLINEPHPFENIKYEPSLRLKKDIAQPIVPKMIVGSPKKLSKKASPTPISKPTTIIGSSKIIKTNASSSPILKPKFLTVLPELLVTATMAPTSRNNIGSAITIITSDEIKRNGAAFVPELLRKVPGLAVSRTGPVGGLTSIRIRGTEANHVLFLIDGMEANDPNTSEALWADILPGDIERIEVLRGSQSSVHGSDAIGGVINIITKRGKGPPKVTAFGEAGSFGTTQAGSSISGGSDDYHYAFNVLKYSTEGISASRPSISNPEPLEKDGYENLTVSSKLGATPAEDLKVGITGRLIINRIDLDEVPFPGQNCCHDFIDDLTKADKRTDFIGGTTGSYKLFNGAWQHDIKAQWSENHKKTTANDIVTSKSVGRKIKVGYQNTIRYDLPKLANSYHTVTTGLDTEHEKAIGTTFKKTRNTRGVFGEYQIELFNRLTLTGSGRHDNNDKFANSNTRRATIAYMIGELGTKFRASYGTGVKNPTFSDLFDSTAPFTASPNLKPESNTSYDFGIDQSIWHDRVQLGGTLFINRVTDLITGFGSGSTNNDGITKIWGIELTADLNITNDLSANASYTYTNHKDPSGQELVRRAKHIASGNLEYRFLTDKARLFLTTEFTGHQADLDFDATFANSTRVQLAPIIKINVGGSYKIMEKVTVNGRLENLLDDQYEEIFGLQSPGLGFYLSLSGDF